MVDDHEMVRAGLAAVLASQSDFDVVGSVGTGEDAVRVSDELSPDVILMDLSLPGISGVEATRRIVKSHPDIKVMMISTFEEPHDVAAAMEAGTLGYYAKHVRPEELVGAIRSMVTDGAAISPAIAARLKENGRVKSVNDLTPREREVLDLIVEGNTNRQDPQPSRHQREDGQDPLRSPLPAARRARSHAGRSVGRAAPAAPAGPTAHLTGRDHQAGRAPGIAGSVQIGWSPQPSFSSHTTNWCIMS